MKFKVGDKVILKKNYDHHVKYTVTTVHCKLPFTISYIGRCGYFDLMVDPNEICVSDIDKRNPQHAYIEDFELATSDINEAKLKKVLGL